MRIAAARLSAARPHTGGRCRTAADRSCGSAIITARPIPSSPRAGSGSSRAALKRSIARPRTGDLLRTDEVSLRVSHDHFLKRLKQLEDGGYGLDRLILSCTN